MSFIEKINAYEILDSRGIPTLLTQVILDNGIKIQVPPFVEVEDEIILDTRTLEYVKKI